MSNPDMKISKQSEDNENDEKKQSYYMKNQQKQKVYKLYQYYKKKYNIDKEICEKYKLNAPLFIKVKLLLEEVKNKCPDILEDLQIKSLYTP